MRSVLKTATYAAMHFVVAFAVAFALTRSWVAAIGIGLVEPFVQTAAYVIHERLWEGRSLAAKRPRRGRADGLPTFSCGRDRSFTGTA